MLPAPPVLLLPGWHNSGPGHWQSHWESQHAYTRVEQHDWQRPLRGDWLMRLEETLLRLEHAAVLVAHGLGCQLVAAWAAHSRHIHRVKAALLVAPTDPQREDLQGRLPSWSAVVMQGLPFASTLVASRSDPLCAFERAQQFAQAWGSQLHEWGEAGHINADSQLGDWPQGHALLQALIKN